MNIRRQGGYIGVLVGSVITALIISFLFVHFMSTPTQVSESNAGLQPRTASGTVPTNKLEEYHADIDAANSIQNKVNVNTQKINQSLEVQ